MGIAKKNLAKALDDYLAKEGCLNPQELSTLCIYPRQLLNNTKNVSINKTLSVTNVTHHFYPATSEEHPMNNYDLNRTPFWKTCTGKKCINFYTLDLG